MKRQQLQAHHGPWGSLQFNRGLGWNQIFALFFLHGCSNSWMSVGEVKIHPFMVKYWVKRLTFLQITSNNYTEA